MGLLVNYCNPSKNGSGILTDLVYQQNAAFYLTEYIFITTELQF